MSVVFLFSLFIGSLLVMLVKCMHASSLNYLGAFVGCITFLFSYSVIRVMQINNAGSNAYSYKPLMEASDEDLVWVFFFFVIMTSPAFLFVYLHWIWMQRSCLYKYTRLDDMLSRGKKHRHISRNYAGWWVYANAWFPQAMNMMLAQPRGGHIFNIDGAGSDGRPTPRSDISFTSFSDAIFLTIFVPLFFHISLSLICFYQICCVWSY